MRDREVSGEGPWTAKDTHWSTQHKRLNSLQKLGAFPYPAYRQEIDLDCVQRLCLLGGHALMGSKASEFSHANCSGPTSEYLSTQYLGPQSYAKYVLEEVERCGQETSTVLVNPNFKLNNRTPHALGPARCRMSSHSHRVTLRLQRPVTFFLVLPLGRRPLWYRTRSCLYRDTG